jgi:hypothetical protein
MRKPARHLIVTGTLIVMLGAPADAQRLPSSGAGDASSTGTNAAALHRLAGVVLDSASSPVTLADLRLTTADGRRFVDVTDAAGRFQLIGVPAGPARLEVRRLGFRPYSQPLMVADADTAGGVRILLTATAAQLTGIEVSGLRDESDPALFGFYGRRRSNSFGHYLDRTEIEATHAQRASDALRTVPGILVQPSRRIGNIVRVRNCRPTVWLDGVRLPDAELDEVTSIDDLAAVEIYKSLAGLPQQFIDRTNPCGAILVWSRTR